MSQHNISLFLYGFTVNANNRYINFKNAALGSELTATLNIGNYTATEFQAEIKRAMEYIDGVNKYTILINRTINGNRSNNMSVTTDGSFLSILFGTGTSAGSSAASLMGFSPIDYTGGLLYTGSTNCGTIVIPDFAAYNYIGPDQFVTSDGTKNVSSNGIKETLVFAQVQFFSAEWRYITNYNGNPQLLLWQNMMLYLIKQLKLEFTPSIHEDPYTYYQCTLESTPQDSNGLGFQLQLMVDQGLYRFYKTGNLKFRLIPYLPGGS